MMTLEQLREIMPNLSGVRAAQYLSHLNAAMAEFGVDTMLRTAAFIAQLAHESGELRWMEEIWGPTAVQKQYEPQTDLSQRLGNTDSGDGKRFKGRGPIQLTGRANYMRFGNVLGLDLIGAPEQVAEPGLAFRIAGLFWQNRGLNELSDAGDFREVTRRINGGFNGLAYRLRYYEKAKAVLDSAFVAGAVPASRGISRPGVDIPVGPLLRGAEAIQELLPTPARGRAPARVRAAKAGPTEPTRAMKATARKPASRPSTTIKTAGKKSGTRTATAKVARARKTATSR